MTVQTTGKRKRRFGRWLLRAVPAVVWLAAVAFAIVLYQDLSYRGSLVGYAAHAPVTLAHPEPTTVRDVRVKLYDQVREGQVLLTLDDAPDRIQLAAIEADIRRLSSEIDAEQARLTMDSGWSSADVDDLSRRFAVDRESAHIAYLEQLAVDASNRMALRGAKIELEFVEGLYETGQAALVEFNDIRTEVESLEALVAGNEEVLTQQREAFEEADRRWSVFTKELDVSARFESVLTPLRLAVDVRRRELEEIVLRIDRNTVRAPFEGQVTLLPAQSGLTLAAGMPLVAISPTTTQQVIAYVPEDRALSIRTGERVEVRRVAAGASDRPFSGKLVSLSGAVDEAPLRFRRAPTVPFWGRGLVVELDEGQELLPGEAVYLALP